MLEWWSPMRLFTASSDMAVVELMLREDMTGFLCLHIVPVRLGIVLQRALSLWVELMDDLCRHDLHAAKGALERTRRDIAAQNKKLGIQW